MAENNFPPLLHGTCDEIEHELFFPLESCYSLKGTGWQEYITCSQLTGNLLRFWEVIRKNLWLRGEKNLCRMKLVSCTNYRGLDLKTTFCTLTLCLSESAEWDSVHSALTCLVLRESEENKDAGGGRSQDSGEKLQRLEGRGRRHGFWDLLWSPGQWSHIFTLWCNVLFFLQYVALRLSSKKFTGDTSRLL